MNKKDSCARCGKKFGFLETKIYNEDYKGYICKDCFKILKEEKEKEAINRTIEQLNKEVQEIISTVIDREKKKISSRIEAGQEVFFYEKLYLPVDSEIIDDYPKIIGGTFDIKSLVEKGLQGWKVVSIIPRTTGITLKNTTMVAHTVSWGGGVGGNITGVYVILEKKFSKENPPPESFLNSYIEKNISYFLNDYEKTTLLKLGYKIKGLNSKKQKK